MMQSTFHARYKIRVDDVHAYLKSEKAQIKFHEAFNLKAIMHGEKSDSHVVVRRFEVEYVPYFVSIVSA